MIKVYLFVLCWICFWSAIEMFRYSVWLHDSKHRISASTRTRRYARAPVLTANLDSKIPVSEYSKLGKQITEVKIEAPSMNTRRITASILIDSPMEKVWSILTDYNNLATHVPNLVKSNLLPSPPGTIRLFQEGAQKIIGFDFRASLTMDMSEDRGDNPLDMDSSSNNWKIGFKLVESKMFDAFDGVWLLRYHSRRQEVNPITNEVEYKYQTKLTYSVFIRPRGPVPVFALEWRIREDVPVNLFALKLASEKLDAESSAGASSGKNRGTANSASGSLNRVMMTGNQLNGASRKPLSPQILVNSSNGWLSDETLQSYIPSSSSPSPPREEERERVSRYPKKIRVYEVETSSPPPPNSFFSTMNSFFGLNSTSGSSYSKVRIS